jgi:hypothetical protein
LIEELAGSPPTGVTRIADTFGIAGMGKTRLVTQLHAEAAAWRDAIALTISFDEASCPTTLSQSFDSFVQLVESMGRRLFARSGRDDGFGEFANELSVAEQERALMSIDADVRVKARRAEVGDDARLGVVDVDIDTGGIEELLLGEKFRFVGSAFLSRYKRIVKRRSALVTVDGFDTIAGSSLARSVLALLARLPNTLVVIVRSPGATAPTIAGVTLERKRLDPFTHDEVGRLLSRSLRSDTVDPRLVDVIYDWSEGHVFTAALAARYLSKIDQPDPDAVARGLARLPDEERAERAEIAVQIARAPGAVDLAETISALAVTRRFDVDLLLALCGDEAPPVPPAAAIEQLREAGLVEPAGEGHYRVHSFVREPLEDRLEPAHRRLLHRRAAEHHYELLTADEPELPDSARAYDNWFRYEKPDWQARLREWLHHNRRAAATDEERERARQQFARVFFDAFWWWGCYLPFPFCPDLVADWRRMRDDDDEWVEDLALLLDAYPPGYRKAGAGRWADVRAALVEVRSSCGLDVDPAQLRDADARHTRALIDNFLAHSLRYRTAASDAERAKWYEQALGYYEESAQLFEQNEESWELAWTIFETAELHADHGDLDRARERWHDAVAVALDEDDWELKANLHRLAADLRWQEGAHAGAFEAHGRAVLHAYLFQCETPSRRPDAYTVTFYREHLERVFERLKTLDADALGDAAERLARPFGAEPVALDRVTAAVAADDPLSLAGLVFPAAPAGAELLEVRSPFTRRVHTLVEDLGGAPASDLAEVEL